MTNIFNEIAKLEAVFRETKEFKVLQETVEASKRKMKKQIHYSQTSVIFNRSYSKNKWLVKSF